MLTNQVPQPELDELSPKARLAIVGLKNCPFCGGPGSPIEFETAPWLAPNIIVECPVDGVSARLEVWQRRAQEVTPC